MSERTINGSSPLALGLVWTLLVTVVGGTATVVWQLGLMRADVRLQFAEQAEQLDDQGDDIRGLRRDISLWVDTARRVVPELQALPPFPEGN